MITVPVAPRSVQDDQIVGPAYPSMKVQSIPEGDHSSVNSMCYSSPAGFALCPAGITSQKYANAYISAASRIRVNPPEKV